MFTGSECCIVHVRVYKINTDKFSRRLTLTSSEKVNFAKLSKWSALTDSVNI